MEEGTAMVYELWREFEGFWNGEWFGFGGFYIW
jgi:hypothetical protein